MQTLQIGAQPSIQQRLPEETPFHYELQKTYLQIEREFVKNDLILYIFDFEDDCTFQDIEPLELHRKIVPRLQLESRVAVVLSSCCPIIILIKLIHVGSHGLQRSDYQCGLGLARQC